jgi:hypothetical protein
MSGKLKLLALSLAVVGIMTAALAGTALAAGPDGTADAGCCYSHGECSDGAGPGLENQWGSPGGNGDCFDEPSD